MTQRQVNEYHKHTDTHLTPDTLHTYKETFPFKYPLTHTTKTHTHSRTLRQHGADTLYIVSEVPVISLS